MFVYFRMNQIHRDQWEAMLGYIIVDKSKPIYFYFPDFNLTYHHNIKSEFFPETYVSRFEFNGIVEYENKLNWSVKKLRSDGMTQQLIHFIQFYSKYQILETKFNGFRIREEPPFTTSELCWYLTVDLIDSAWDGSARSV